MHAIDVIKTITKISAHERRVEYAANFALLPLTLAVYLTVSSASSTSENVDDVRIMITEKATIAKKRKTKTQANIVYTE